MKPAPFDYLRPGSLAEATAALAEEPNAKVLAGGQSLVPLLSMRLAAPSMLVDINGLPDLSDIEVTGEGVRIGALARHADVLASGDVRRVQPLVSMALANVAHATIRNRGTTVGSIVHADAAAEMPAVLLLLGGSVEVRVRHRNAHHRCCRPFRRPAGDLAASRRDRGVRVLPGPRGAGRCRVRRGRASARGLRTLRSCGDGAGRW